MIDWVEQAKKHSAPLALGAVFAAMIGAPWTVWNFHSASQLFDRAEQLHARELAFVEKRVQQAASEAKNDASKENMQRRIANLTADNTRLRELLTRAQDDLAQALAADADAQVAKAILQRDQELRQKLDAYVEEALAQTAALDTITDACEHFAAWKALVDLRERIATMAPLLSSGANSYLNWLQQSGRFVQAGLLVPQCAINKSG